MPEKVKLLRKDIESHSLNDDIATKKNIILYCVQISANICSYCSKMMKGPGLRMSLLIFSPKLTESVVNCKFVCN